MRFCFRRPHALEPLWQYRSKMVVLVRVARVALLLILAVIAVSLVVGMFRPETGVVEKVALAVLFAGCLAVGSAVRSVASRLQSRAASR